MERVEVPKLVGRCREFEKETIGVGSFDEDQLSSQWKKLGLRESIRRPEGRSQ